MAAASSPHLEMVSAEEQPLDLSLDKSKCGQRPEAVKNKNDNRPAISDENSDEPDEEEDEDEDDEEDDWASHQHQQVG